MCYTDSETFSFHKHKNININYIYKCDAIEIVHNMLPESQWFCFAKSDGHLCVFILSIVCATFDAIEHSFPLEPVSLFDFWFISLFQFFSKLTGCSFFVSFATSFPSSNPLNVGMSCTQFSDFYLSSLSFCFLNFFLGDLI